MPFSNGLLLKQMAAIQKAGNNVTLRDDNSREFYMDAIATAGTLPKLFVHFANSAKGTIDTLGVKRRNLKEHKGITTTPDGRDFKEEESVPYVLGSVYWDAWIENSNTFYTARMRGQDVRQALLSLQQQQYAADIQDLAYNGDEASADEFLKLNDGFIVQAKDKAVVKKVGATLPTVQELTALTGQFESKYLDNTFIWHMSHATNMKYVAEIQNRQTNLGDATIVGGKLTVIAGYNVEIVDNMQNDVILFTPFANLAQVPGREVTLTTAAQDSLAVAKQATYHFMLSDIDFVIRQPKALGYIAIGTPED